MICGQIITAARPRSLFLLQVNRVAAWLLGSSQRLLYEPGVVCTAATARWSLYASKSQCFPPLPLFHQIILRHNVSCFSPMPSKVHNALCQGSPPPQPHLPPTPTFTNPTLPLTHPLTHPTPPHPTTPDPPTPPHLLCPHFVVRAVKVQLELPRQRSLRTVIDRMKGIDKFLYVDADMGGQLVFRCSRLLFFFGVCVFDGLRYFV